MEFDKVNFEAVIDKIIEITEKNLTIQGEFLKSIYELKLKLETFDHDHDQIKKNMDIVVSNSFEIINKMKMASNETIISLIETLTEKIKVIEKINDNVVDLKVANNQLKESCTMIGTLSEDVKVVASSHKWITKILGLIAMLVLGFQIIFTLYKVNKDSELQRQIFNRFEVIEKAQGKIEY